MTTKQNNFVRDFFREYGPYEEIDLDRITAIDIFYILLNLDPQDYSDDEICRLVLKAHVAISYLLGV